jgi:hypothetical protein
MICCQCREFMDDAYVTEARGEYICLNCHIDKLDKQLAAKDREIASLKSDSSAEMRETLMHQLMTCADEKDALQKKLDDYKQYVNVGHYSDLEKELAEARREVEKLRVQLAGCGVAACGGTSESQIAKPGDYGYSASYQNTLNLRIEYDELKAELEKCKLREMVKSQKDLDPDIQKVVNENFMDLIGEPSEPEGA